MSFAVLFSPACLLLLWSQSLPLLWGMSPLSALANDGQLKAHSQDSNQIYSLLTGLEEAGGRAFISVFLSLFVLLFALWPVCRGGLQQSEWWRKEELSAEMGVQAEPTRARSAEAWLLQSIVMGDNVLSAGWGSVHRPAEWEDASHRWHWERKAKRQGKEWNIT